MNQQQILEGDWNEIKGNLRARWGQLTDDDLTPFHEFRGEVDQLVGAIQRKTGEGREAVEKYLNDLSGAAAPAVDRAAENIRQYAKRTAEQVQSTARQAADQVRAHYAETESFVRERPGQALAMSFGAGLVAGLLVSIVVGSK